MSRPFNEWLASVRANYGDLKNFEDACSIRIMRERLLKELSDRASSDDGAKTEGISEARAGVELLDQWLAEKGLEP